MPLCTDNFYSFKHTLAMTFTQVTTRYFNVFILSEMGVFSRSRRSVVLSLVGSVFSRKRLWREIASERNEEFLKRQTLQDRLLHLHTICQLAGACRGMVVSLFYWRAGQQGGSMEQRVAFCCIRASL